MTVLIIADQAGFARDIVGRWQTERSVPEFAVVSSTVWQRDAECAAFDLAIVGPMDNAQLAPLLQSLEQAGAPVVCVVDDAQAAQRLRDNAPRTLILRRHEGWLEAMVLLAGEILRRVELQARMEQAEAAAAAASRHATLGCYMLEMRHSLNNALTSVLGNAELLLLEPGSLSASVRDQVDTIHSMALRMREMLQRFSSLDAEMHCAEKQSQGETRKRAHSPAAGA